MRASQLKEDLLALVDLGHDVASRILADLSPRTLKRIQEASRVDYLPLEIDLELVRAIEAAVGEEGLRDWGRAAVLRSAKTSVLRPLIETVVRILGLTPAALFKAAPQAWRITFRDCGELVLGPSGPPLTVGLRGLPPILVDRAFLLSISGSLEAVFPLAGVEGEVRLVAPGDGFDARFEARWTAR